MRRVLRRVHISSSYINLVQSRYKPSVPQNEVNKIVTALEKDSKTVQEVIQLLNPDLRRKMVVAGSALEWFGKEKVSEEITHADADRDRIISPKDFDKWFENALERKNALAANEKNEVKLPWSALMLLALEAGLPFVGFGFLDNSIMILAGDAIDRTMGFYLHCSVMASAAMGNVCSGVMGMQMHGLVEKVVQLLRLPTPALTEEQRRSQTVFFAGHLGGSIGVAVGLGIGMLPLLLIEDEDEKTEKRLFSQLDRDHDDRVSAGELQRSLSELGIPLSEVVAQKIVQKFGGTERGSIDFSEFRSLCQELRAHHRIVN